MTKNFANVVFSFVCLVFSINSPLLADTRIAHPIRAEVGVAVILDPTDGFIWDGTSELRPEWSWESRPATSVAEFSDITIIRPTVTVDVPGTFVARVDLFDAADLSATTPLVSSMVTLRVRTH